MAADGHKAALAPKSGDPRFGRFPKREVPKSEDPKSASFRVRKFQSREVPDYFLYAPGLMSMVLVTLSPS